MSETTLFYVLIFIATVLLTLSFASAFVRPMTAGRKINRRLAIVQSGITGSESLALLRRERWLTGDRYGNNLGELRKLLVQSGVRFEVMQIAAILLVLWAISFIGFWLIDGISLLSILGPIAVIVVVPLMFLLQARARRIQKFAMQIPDVIDLLVRSLRAGHPLSVAFSLAAREMPDPAGTEFGIMADEVQFGATIPDAMANMSYRVGDPDLDYLLTCITVQGQTGGNLGEVLARLARLMRERFRLARKVRALTSEARTTGVILSFFPLALFGVINLVTPSYYSEVWHLPSFQKTLLTCGALLLLGNFVMRRLADIKY